MKQKPYIGFILIIVLALVSFEAKAAIVAGDIVSCFPFDTNFNDTKSALSSEAINSIEITTDSKIGAGALNISFESPCEYLELDKTIEDLTLQDEFTISFWVKYDSTGADVDGFVSSFDGADGGMSIKEDGTQTFQFVTRRDAAIENFAGIPIIPNVWQFMSFSFNATELCIINATGTQVCNANDIMAGGTIKEGLNLSFGIRRDTKECHIGFLMDDLRIYNRRISNADLEANKDASCYTAPAPAAGATFAPTFNLYTNLTAGNYTNKPFRVNYTGTLNYNYSGFLGNDNLIMFLPFENNDTPTATDITANGNDGTITQAIYTNSGYNGGALEFGNDSNSDYVVLDDSNKLITNDSAFSIMLWFNPTQINETEKNKNRLINFQRSSSPSSAINLGLGIGNLTSYYYDGATGTTVYINTSATDLWQHVAVTYDGTDFKYYHQGELKQTITDTFGGMGSSDAVLGAFSATDSEDFYYGKLDEIRIYNKTLTGTQINKIYTSSYPLFTCELFMNNTKFQTMTSLNITNNYNLTMLTDEIQGGYVGKVNCSDGFLNATDTANNIFIDTVIPTIAVTDLVNNSILYRNIDKITFSALCTDLNLFACNTTLWRLNADGTHNTSINSTQAINIISTTYKINYTIKDNTSINITKYNITNGRYELQALAWDSHTAKDINDYKITKKTNSLLFQDTILISGDINEITKVDYKKKSDRYIWEFKFNCDNCWNYLDLNSSDLYYLPNSEYNAHFIDFSNKKWIDFNSDQVSNFYVENTGLNKYRINFYNTEKTVFFESIGDLNNASSNYFFNVTDPFSFTAVDAISLTTVNNFTALVYNNSLLIRNQSTTTGKLYINITEGNYITNITTISYNMNFTNITYLFNTTFEWKLFRLNSLYLFFYDELTDTLINNTNVSIDILGPNSSQTQTTETGNIFLSDFATGSYELRYNAPGYQQNAYFTTIATSSTQRIDLYLVNNLTSSLIVFTLLDEKNNPVYNATLIRYRFFINNNAWLIVGESKADANGETGQYLTPNDVFYKFVVTRNGLTLFSGSQQQIYSSSVFLRVPLLADALKSYRIVRDKLTTSITYNNDTKIVSFFWNDGGNIVSFGCLDVITPGLRKETVYQTCANGVSATVTFNMTSIIKNNTLYRARGFVETNTAGSIYYEEFLEFIQGAPWEQFGNVGLFLGYIFIATMFFIGLPFSFSIAVVYSVVAMIGLNLIGITFFGYTFIVVVSVIGLVVALVNKI